MRYVLFFVISCLPVLCFSQSRISIKNGYALYNQKDTINRTVNGLKEGLWYDYTICVKSTSCFGNDSSGCQITMDCNYISIEGHYLNGEKIGIWTYYTDLGQIEYTEQYSESGGDLSLITHYFANGHVKSKVFVNSDNPFVRLSSESEGNLSLITHYFANGQVKTKVSDNSENPSTRLSSESGGNPLLITHYFANGQIKAKVFVNSENPFTRLSFFKNGSKVKEVYKDTEHTQELIVFYENGQLHYEAFVVGDVVKHFVLYYETGEKKYEGTDVYKWRFGSLTLFNVEGKRRLRRPSNFGTLMFDEDLSDFL